MHHPFIAATCRTAKAGLFAASLLLGLSAPLQANPTVVIVGDSIGEGVQAADAAWQTQIYAYGRWVAHQLGAELIIPYI
ncbi:MAG: hypothetical protein WBG92_02140, partial [Thiohalocapsa sp.]